MNITTEFSVDDEVYIIAHNGIMKQKISKVRVEQSVCAVKNPLVIYEFYKLSESGQDNYRYENEVGGTPFDLFKKVSRQFSVNPSAADEDGGVTDDLVKLQKFVRDCASNWDCDPDTTKVRVKCSLNMGVGPVPHVVF